MAKKILWILFVVLAIIVGLYPGIYFILDRKFGLLSSKSEEVLGNLFWNIGFYTHIILGGVALLVGWAQFGTKFRNRNLDLHRTLGKIYVIAALLSSSAGIGIGFVANGGLIASIGFICLGSTWLYSTLMAYVNIRNGHVKQHQIMMIYSYAACAAAITLRIWLPLLVMATGKFITAYTIVAWLCWVPNILIAYLIVRNLFSQKIETAALE